MVSQKTSVALLGATCIAFAAQAAPPRRGSEPPSISDRNFGPTIRGVSDLSWLRPIFDGGSGFAKARKSLINWSDARRAQRTAAARAELAAILIPKRPLPEGCYGDVACTWITWAQTVAPEFGSWEAFEAELEVALDYVERNNLAKPGADIADAAPDSPLRTRLEALQVNARALPATEAMVPDDLMVPGSRRQKQIVLALLKAEADARSIKNAELLADAVNRHGWPKESLVGEEAARAAFLVAQGADHSPTFQLKMLRMMAPLVGAGEVKPLYYAYLYDRVTSKLNGVQRFGTQFRCVDGRYTMLPLESMAALRVNRRMIGLPTSNFYTRSFPQAC